MDTMVLTVQQWLNTTYGSNSKFTNVLSNGVAENGLTGTEVEKALITALQIELGISTPTGTFGLATASAFTSMQIRSSNNLSNPTNKEYILQGGLWCKGYNPGGWTGIFYTKTQTSVEEFKADAGLSNCDGIVTAMIMKALLNTDPFVLSSGGDTVIRQIQQNLNNRCNTYTGLLPTNGLYVAATNKALIYALQAEEGLSTSTANGSFGTTTTADCPTLSFGDTRTNFVRILQYALYCNGYDSGTMDGVYDSDVTSAVKNYQSFMCLPVTGIANMPTIKATMASCGDTSRSASACDCATILTAYTAATLKSNGYRYIGRYLTGTAGGVSKALTAAEIQIIFDAGLNFFPIYETSSTYESYFTPSQAVTDAAAAITKAKQLGLPKNTIIYFAVDFDAMDYQITNSILPYFNVIKYYFDLSTTKTYSIDVYGARNICSRVCNSCYAVSSFVGDMSTGYSGNLGFLEPTNCAFDQFTTVTIGSGNGKIQIDKDSFSGKDLGVSHVDQGITAIDYCSLISQLKILYDITEEYTNGQNRTIKDKNILVLQYLRHLKYYGIKWDLTSGTIDNTYIAFVNSNVGFSPSDIIINVPDLGVPMGIDHLAATASAQIFNSVLDVEVNDLSGWAGDLLQLEGKVDAASTSRIFVYDDIYTLISCSDKEAQSFGFTSAGDCGFGWDDLYQDIDGYNIGKLLDSTPIYEIFQDYYTNGYKNRFESFYDNIQSDYVTAAIGYTTLYDVAFRYTGGGTVGSTVFQLFGQDFDEKKWGDLFANAFSNKMSIFLGIEQAANK